MMRGLPASGKSTMAKEISLKMGNAVRINKDLLREMLHFGRWSGPNEGRVRKVSTFLATTFLLEGQNVIIDDTNLGKEHHERWRQIALDTGSKFEIVTMDTDLYTCLMRDAQRQTRVGPHVITQMAMQYGHIDPPAKGYVLCDLDGTLADVSGRLHYLHVSEGEKKNWDGFFSEISQDPIRQDVLAMLKDFVERKYTIVFVSARPDKYRAVTERWLEKTGIPYLTLIMRRSNDRRPDNEVKEGMLNTYFLDKSLIHRVIDDRPRVIAMWRENGLEVIDVGTGEEF